MAFTATNLTPIIGSIEQIWADNIRKQEYMVDTTSFDAIIRDNQTARLGAFERDGKEIKGKISWVDACLPALETDCGEDCDLGGVTASTATKDIVIAQCTPKATFTVNENDLRGNDMEMAQFIAPLLMRRMKQLDEVLIKKALAFVDLNAGTNAFTAANGGVGTWTALTKSTNVAAASWTRDLFPFLNLAAIKNNFTTPYLLSGMNLWVDNWNAQINQPNGEGKGTAAAYDFFKKYFDLYYLDTVNSPDMNTYLLNKGAVAFASKNWYGAAPTRYDFGQTRYSLPSNNLAGVRYDVHYEQACVANKIEHRWGLFLDFDYFLNPLGCDATKTGILKYKKV